MTSIFVSSSSASVFGTVISNMGTETAVPSNKNDSVGKDDILD
jgi:hypothetical protein